ncbi:MAG TPA: hypothetical protein VIA06_19125 [Candidatus Dormibacteraeota bacterium]|jgi:hypothetical protein|nr:hypothetical protein [Candidatus Dormibacteraeota bacterium]
MRPVTIEIEIRDLPDPVPARPPADRERVALDAARQELAAIRARARGRPR